MINRRSNGSYAMRYFLVYLILGMVSACATSPNIVEPQYTHTAPQYTATAPENTVPERGVRIDGNQLRSLIAGSTMYGIYLDDHTLSFVRYFDPDGSFLHQYSRKVSGKDGRPVRQVRGRWAIKGSLLCYSPYDISFDNDCVQIYRAPSALQFADPASGEIFSVTTKVVLADGTSLDSSERISDAGPTAEGPTSGSGFIVSASPPMKDVYLLTNAHVVSECKSIQVKVGAADKAATLVALDKENDLALLSIAGGSYPAATFRSGDGIRAGESIVGIGFPLRGLLADEANITTGTVSALAGLGNDKRYLQITAPIQAGNSGGPLFDQSANVVGVIVAKLDAIAVANVTGDIPQNVNFAIKQSVAEQFLKENGIRYVSRASVDQLSQADIADRGKKLTVPVECW